jgi:hypothetical protein
MSSSESCGGTDSMLPDLVWGRISYEAGNTKFLSLRAHVPSLRLSGTPKNALVYQCDDGNVSVCVVLERFSAGGWCGGGSHVWMCFHTGKFSSFSESLLFLDFSHAVSSDLRAWLSV